MARSHEKGARGEREVVAMFRAAGYLGTMRAPGSGSLRSYGAGSPSPFPGDIIVKLDEYAQPEPWLVEVKYDERYAEGGTRTWQGSTFLMATLRALAKEADRTKVIGRPRAAPVLFVRSARRPWRVWIPEGVMWSQFLWSDQQRLAGTGWMEVEPEVFFEEVCAS